MRCRGRVADAFEPKPSADEEQQNWLEEVLFVANEVIPKYVDWLFKLGSDELEEEYAEDIQSLLRSAVVLIVRLSNHPGLTKGMDALAKILMSGKGFYKKNGTGAIKSSDSDDEEDEEEDYEEEDDGIIRVPVGVDLLSAIIKDDDLDFLHYPPPYLAADFNINDHRGEGDSRLSDEQVLEVSQLISAQKVRAQRYRAALDFTALSAPSMDYFEDYYFGAKDLTKEIKREVREEKRRRKANKRAKNDGIERSTTPSSTSSSNSALDASTGSETDSVSETSGVAPAVASDLPAHVADIYQVPMLSEDSVNQVFENLFPEEDPMYDQIDGAALRRRVRGGRNGDEEDETDEEEDDAEDNPDDENAQYRFINLNDEQNWLFYEGYLSKKSISAASVYVRKHANFVVRSGAAAILLRRILKCSILHPSVVNRMSNSPSLAAFAPPAETSKYHSQLYPLFNSSASAFYNFTGAFKTLCRLLSFVHPSIQNQLISHLIAVYRNVFLPLSVHVEGMRQDLFAKECEDVHKIAEIKLFAPAKTVSNVINPNQSLMYNESQIAALASSTSYRRRIAPSPVLLYIPGHGQTPFFHLYTHDELSKLSNLVLACPWNFAAAQSPLIDCLDGSLNFPALKESSDAPERMPANFASRDRNVDDVGAELQLIRAMASLDCHVLERRLQGMNALVDVAKDSANTLLLDRERRQLLSEYASLLTRYQAELTAYKEAAMARQQKQQESPETRALPLVPPRKPEHPLQVPASPRTNSFYDTHQTQKERKIEQLNSFNHLTHPVHCVLPQFLQQHAETLLKSFFGARAHVAVVPKAREVLTFFAQQNLLTEAHLDYIWQSHLSKHISIVHLVWEVLDALTPTMKLELVDHLFGLIQREIFHPDHSSLLLSPQLFALLKKITSVGIQMQDSVLQEEIETARLAYENSRNTIDSEFQLGARELQQEQPNETDEQRNARSEALEQLEMKAGIARQDAEMRYESVVSAVSSQPRKLYGLWTMLLVLTDGTGLSSQVTVPLINDIVGNFFRPLCEWIQCLPIRLPLLVHLLARIRRQSSVAQSILVFNAILATFIPYKTFMEYSPTQRAEFLSIPSLPHLPDQRTGTNPLSLVPVPSPATINGTAEIATTQHLVGSLSIPFVSTHLPISHAVGWLQEHFGLQRIVVEAMSSYKSSVFKSEAGIAPEEFEQSLVDSSNAVHHPIPSNYVVQCIGNKALEERRNAGNLPSDAAQSYLPGSPFSYLDHITIRMNFMVTVAHVSPKTLEADELAAWWSLLTQWTLTKRELKLVCEHLTQLLFNYATGHFPVSESDMRLLFGRLERELDAYEVTTSGLDLVKAFIVFHSWKNNQYVPLNIKEYPSYTFGFAIDGDINTIPGLHLFWKVATHAKDVKAAEQAAKHIVAFYEFPRHESSKPLFQTAFVNQAIEILKEDYETISNTGGNKADQRTSPFLSVSRCLALIRKVLSSNRSAPTTRGAPIRLILKGMQGNGQEISLYYNDPVSMIRAKAAQMLNVSSPNDVRLIFGGKELKSEIVDNVSISQLRDVTITPGSSIHVIKRNPGALPVSAASANGGAENQVSTIASLLSSEPHFSLFFNLLLLASSSSEHSELAHQVWSLLMDLPHNRELMSGLKSITNTTANGDGADGSESMDLDHSEVAWNVLLDPSNCFRLFYSLQIVESLLRPREGTTDSSAQWVQAFESSGGVRHLLRLLLTAPLAQPEQGFKRFPAASLLLDLLSIFVPEQTASSSRRGINAAALVPMFSDPLLLPAEGDSPAASPTELIQLFVRRLMELGIASAAEQVEESASSAGQEGSESVPTTPAEPSSQEAEDDVNAVARTTKSAARKEEGVASNAEVVFAQLCPFILALASTPEHLTTILSAPMKPYWSQIMAVVFQSGCDDLKVRSSLFNTVSSLILLSDQFGVNYFGDVALTLAEKFLASNPASGSPKARSHSGEFFSLLVVIIGRMFALEQDLVESLAASEELGKWQLLEQHHHSSKLISSSANHAVVAKRLHGIVSQIATQLIGYTPRERRGDVTVDSFLVGLLTLTRSCVLLFPSWAYTHEALLYGGDRPRLNDNPLLETAVSDSPAAQGRHSIVCSIGNLLFRIPTPDNVTAASSASVALSSSSNGIVSVPPACKTVEARTTAFALLLTLTHPIIISSYAHLSGAKQNEPSTALIHLTALIDNFIIPRHIGRSSINNGISSWSYVPLGMEKASCGYVGLRNLAATCYMNSLMQQFYMVPQFRARIFSLVPYLPEGTEAPTTQNTGKSTLTDSRNVLFQLQSLFAHLQESQLKYYDPTSFTKVYKDPDGRVMNPVVQMDAEEFFAGLLDKIESVVKGTPDEKAVRDFFGGSLWQQVEAKDCGHVSRREEEMLTIPVEVKGKANLYQSLEAFVKADILDGDNKYQCSQCNQMVDARKYACLGRLPDNLVFSLKRFDFDFETLTRVKVHDYFEFPQSLSVEPYTADGLMRKSKLAKGEALTDEDKFDPEDFEYSLSGIVIHRGSADSGHYYSYIKDRNSSPDRPRWYLFNDMSVESFDEHDIPALAFGGEDPHRRTMKAYSAYMLFYTKKKPVHQTAQARLESRQLSESVPRPLFANTWLENSSFLLDQQIYDNHYLEFATSLVNRLSLEGDVNENDNASAVALTRLGFTLVTETLMQMKSKSWYTTVMTSLTLLVRTNAAAAGALLSSLLTPQAASVLAKVFVQCPLNDIKNQFSSLISEALVALLSSKSNDSETAKQFVDLWVHKLLESADIPASKLPMLNPWETVVASVASSANVLAIALENAAARPLLAPLLISHVHSFMTLLTKKIAGPADEESKKKYKDWRKPLAPLVSLISLLVASSNPTAVKLPVAYLDASIGSGSANSVLPLDDSSAYQSLPIELLPLEVYPLRTEGDETSLTALMERPTLSDRTWEILTDDGFLATLLDDPGLSSSVSEPTIKFFEFLGAAHPVWTRHLLIMCLTRMKDVGYERYENLVAVVPVLLTQLRQARQLAFDAAHETRTRLVSVLQARHANSSAAEKAAVDGRWSWLLFPGGNSDALFKHFANDYLSSTSVNAGSAMEGVVESSVSPSSGSMLPPNFDASAVAELSALVNEDGKWSITDGSRLQHVVRLAKAVLAHSALAHWLGHKAFPLLLDTKKALKLASFWSLRCALDCVQSDFEVRRSVQTEPDVNSPLVNDLLPLFIIFEKCERVRSVAERLIQAIAIGNDERRRIWSSTSDDIILDSAVSTSTINSPFSPVAVPVLPRRYLGAEIDPLWEDRDRVKAGIENVISSTGILTLPGPSEYEEVQLAVNNDLAAINAEMLEEQGRRRTDASSHLVVFAESLGYDSERVSVKAIVEKQVSVMKTLWSTLVTILKAVTKGAAISPIDAAREKERPAKYELFFKYRLVQLLRSMTWILMRVPHANKLELKTECFENCVDVLVMLWREGVGEEYDANRSALYAFIDVLSHDFSPILQTLAEQDKFLHMNIHVNLDKSCAKPICAFNDRTSAHFFRIILRTILLLDEIEKAKAGTDQGKVEAGRFKALSQAKSLLDVGIVQLASDAVTVPAIPVKQNQVLSNLSEMPAWNWSLQWLYVRGGPERYPTLAVVLEQLVRLVMKRVDAPKRENVVTSVISQMETLPLSLASYPAQTGANAGLFGSGAPSLLLLNLLGTLAPDAYTYEPSEGADGRTDTPLPANNAEVDKFTTFADGRYLSNAMDATHIFMNPYKSVATSPYLPWTHPEVATPELATQSPALSAISVMPQGVAVTDWSVRYPMKPFSPLVTLVLPAATPTADASDDSPASNALKEGVTSWLQDTWVLIQHRLLGATMAFLNPSASATASLPAVLSSSPVPGTAPLLSFAVSTLLSHPSATPNPSQRAAYDMLQVLRLALSWIVPLANAKNSKKAGGSKLAFPPAEDSQTLGHRPLLPLQRIMYELFREDPVILTAAEDTAAWISMQEMKHAELVALSLVHSILLNPASTQALKSETTGETKVMRESLISIAVDIVEALSSLSSAVALSTLTALRQAASADTIAVLTPFILSVAQCLASRVGPDGEPGDWTATLSKSLELLILLISSSPSGSPQITIATHIIKETILTSNNLAEFVKTEAASANVSGLF